MLGVYESGADHRLGVDQDRRVAGGVVHQVEAVAGSARGGRPGERRQIVAAAGREGAARPRAASAAPGTAGASEKVCELKPLMALLVLAAATYQVKLSPAVSAAENDVPVALLLLTTAWFVVVSTT